MGNILLPEKHRLPSHRGMVVATGPGVYEKKKGRFIATRLLPGDDVIFAPWGHLRLKVNDVEFIMTMEENVLMVLRNTPPETIWVG